LISGKSGILFDPALHPTLIFSCIFPPLRRVCITDYIYDGSFLDEV
jgi:hypothetical protein